MKYLITARTESGELKMVDKHSKKKIEWTSDINDAWLVSSKHKSSADSVIKHHVNDSDSEIIIDTVSYICVYDTFENAIDSIENCIKVLNKTVEVMTFTRKKADVIEVPNFSRRREDPIIDEHILKDRILDKIFSLFGFRRR